MKKSVLVLCLVIGMMFVASMAFAQAYSGGTGITATPHDLSGAYAGATAYGNASDTLNRICVYCHAPHNTLKPGTAYATDNDGIAYLPLWNHAITTMRYNMYSNGAEEPDDSNHASYAESVLAGKDLPGSVSRLCLSCHDGSVATASYGFYGATSTNVGTLTVTGTAFAIGAGGNLSNHHPIGFNYASAQATDDELAATTAIMTGSVSIADLLWNNNMECTTCHDVHNTKNETGAEKFLWKSDANSAFCGTCHLKL